MISHPDISDPFIHEPKGAASASDGHVMVSNGDGTTSWVSPTTLTVSQGRGWYYYTDSSTGTTPINVPVNTPTILTNDTSGNGNDISYGLPGVVDVWNSTNNQLDFSGLTLGDVIQIRADITVTTSVANQNLTLQLRLAEGQPSEYIVPLLSTQQVKNSGPVSLSPNQLFPILNEPTRNSPGQIEVLSDATCSVVVNGWFVEVQKRVG